MKNLSEILLALSLMLLVGLSSCKVADYSSTSKPVSHAIWDSLLRKNVNEAGFVDYKGFIQDSLKFNEYLGLLANNHPNEKNWSKDERLAYWINAYNAFTVKLIMDHYPVESIKDIKNGIPFVNTVWDIKFIKIEDATYDLNNIEHGIIRPKFKDFRIHFAVNCASYSCPKLLNRAFTGDKLDAQLDQAARDFLADPTKNVLTKNEVQLSKILYWYRGDFKKYKNIIDFVNAYGPMPVNRDAKVTHLPYQWSLNEQKEAGEAEGTVEN